MKKLIYLILIYILALSFNIYTQTEKIKIIATTDVHGSIFPHDFSTGKEKNSSLAHVMSFVRKERNNKLQEVFLFDNGDILQGSPAVYFYNYESTPIPHLVSRVFNYMGYDVCTIGNHDIEAGHEVYDKIVKEMKMPWLAANALNSTNNLPYFTPYKIFNTSGIKIAVLGMITPLIPEWLPESLWENIIFEDIVASSKKWIEIIKKEENPDFIIGLFHSGVDFNYGNQTENTLKNENAVALTAKYVEGFDVIISGHDHKEYNRKINNTIVLGPGSHCNKVGVIEINLSTKEISSSIQELNDFSPDSLFLDEFSEDYNKIISFVSEKIGFLEYDITTKNAYFGNSEFVDLIHKIQLDVSSADISFAAPLSFDVTLKKGDLDVGSMFNLYKYENFLYTIKLSGNEIKKYLEYSYANWFNTVYSSDDFMLSLREIRNNSNDKERRKKYQLTTPYYNLDYAVGLNYSVDISKKPNERITIISLSDGNPFDLEKTYTVVLNSYRGNGGGGHLTQGVGLSKDELKLRLISSSKRDFRKFIIDYIKNTKKIIPFRYDNWKIIPEEIFNKCRQIEFELLFGL